MHETTVVLGLEDPALQEEVLHFLDRLPRVRVVGAVADGPGLAREVRRRQPEATVASPGVLESAPDLDGAALLVVSQVENTEALRTALRVGASGFYLWPEERDGLGRDTERAARPPSREAVSPGRVVAVHAPRGGAGCTFLATNLAAACADRDADTVLVDLDQFGADVTAALGVRPEDAVPTIADVVLLVVTLDVLGLRAARRAVDLLAGLEVEDRCWLVLNRVSRGEIVAADAERVLGLPVVSIIRNDRSVLRSQNRGELVAGRGSPAGRRVG